MTLDVVTLDLVMSFKYKNKHYPSKGTKGKLELIQLKILYLCKTLLGERKNKIQSGRKYFQNIYLLMNLYPNFPKNS
jgi:hypothetical protein